MEPRVLVVEDDVEINELLGEYLALEGIPHDSAFDGKSALTRVAASPPDAIILDVMLPDIDGYEICRTITSQRATASIPIIMLTCLNADCDRRKGLAAGAYGYMNKPFLPDDLIARLLQAFAWRANLPLRPPLGQFELSTTRPENALRSINDMVVDLFNHAALADPAIVGIREGFQTLLEWAESWGKQKKRTPHLVIDFRMIENAAGEIATARPADRIEWTISEPEPGLLADTLLGASVEPAPLMVARPGALEPLPGGNPLTPWYQFLAKCGVPRFERDTQPARLRLQRPLRPESSTFPNGLPSPLLTLNS